jgi:hypothetical protein
MNTRESQILRYVSAPKVYGFETEQSPNTFEIDNLVLHEDFSEDSRYASIRQGLGNYSVVIETSISQSSQLPDRYEEVSIFARELDRAWMYACGHPLTKKKFSFTAPHIIPMDGLLDGWTTNYEDVKERFREGHYRIETSLEHIHHAVYSFFPLSLAIAARAKYLAATEILRTLIDLHFYSHKATDGYSMCFFLAKALELVRAHLPGKTDQQKEKHLHTEVRVRMVDSLHSLYGLSNTRFEIRHIVNQHGTLYPRLTTDELYAFQHDADLVVRSVVCSELGLDLLIPTRD